MRRALFFALAMGLAVTGCGRKKHVRMSHPPSPSSRPRIEPRVGQTEEGIASWYGHPYHGRQAADGEIYDMEKLVAAHRTLPFHTWVRVHNLDNSKNVDVEIIDRGPFIDGRIIDLSHRAAQEVAMIGPGTARVRIEIIVPPAGPVVIAHFAVQVGAYSSQAVAERMKNELAGRYGFAKLVPRAGSPTMWRVLVGNESSEDAANALADRIRKEGGEKVSAFVVRLDGPGGTPLTDN
jgi:rare lipoprotein A